MVCLGTLFLPMRSVVAVGLQVLVTHGGLLIFGGFMFHKKHKIISNTEPDLEYHPTPYNPFSDDPIYASIKIYMEVNNILVRMLTIMQIISILISRIFESDPFYRCWKYYW
ncbi:growth hormone-inducible transmembrane protein-like [Pocillopora damicornis]|uniref:growth hormone-inducible transmembrane protein-like n=1 Tax=Pocillopora damicornis TaxID=46731 RepID=UPI000F556A2B|nr:growth hormone-inducible transmembrane protein-like [Pocillopora damicornis]